MLSICLCNPAAMALRGEFESMRGCVSLMVAITNDLLDLEKLRAGKLHLEPTCVNLRELASQTVQEVKPATSVPMRVVIAHDAPKIVRTGACHRRVAYLPCNNVCMSCVV